MAEVPRPRKGPQQLASFTGVQNILCLQRTLGIWLVPAKAASLDAFRALGSGLGFGMAFCFDRPVGGKADLIRGGPAKYTKCMHARLCSKGEKG